MAYLAPARSPGTRAFKSGVRRWGRQITHNVIARRLLQIRVWLHSLFLTVIAMAFKLVLAGLVVVLLLLELPLQSQGESTQRLQRQCRLVDLEYGA